MSSNNATGKNNVGTTDPTPTATTGAVTPTPTATTGEVTPTPADTATVFAPRAGNVRGQVPAHEHGNNGPGNR